MRRWTYPGAIYDPDHQYSPFVEPWAMWYQGKPYTEYTSPFIWASVPLYALFGHAGLMLLPWLSGMLLIIMSAWLAWRVRPDRSAALAPIIVGFGSPLLIYSLEFWEHTPGTALAVFALVGVIKALDSRRRAGWLIASGAAIGLSLTMRAELYVYPIAIVIGLLFIRSALPLIRSIDVAGRRRTDHCRAVVGVSIRDVGQSLRAALAAECAGVRRHGC